MQYDYIAPDKIQATIKAETGELIVYTMTTAMLIQSVNQAVALINSQAANVLRDIKVF